MRLSVLLVGLALTGSASAQSVGDAVTLTEDVRSMRFPDADVTGPTFDEGQSATVLYVMDDRVRLRAGNSYGWVAITSVAMPDPLTLPIDDE